MCPGITLLGELTVLPWTGGPASPFFGEGARYPICLRYGNEREFDDDAILDGRYALLRLFSPSAGGGGEVPGEQEALLDLVLFSGKASPLRSARELARWLVGSRADRAEVLRDCEGAGERLRRFLRDPESYAALHYHGWGTCECTDTGGERRLARYRLIRPGGLPDTGAIDPELVRLPLDFVPRRPGDSRAPTYLRDEIRRRLGEGPVMHVLQVQLRPLPDTVAALHAAADPTQPWPEDSHPWRDLALITLDREAAAPARRDIRPERLPEGLRLLRAYSDTEPASMAHLFAITNDIQVRLLDGLPMAAPLGQLVQELFPGEQSVQTGSELRRRRVGIIGGGAAGLTAAFELERRGHAVTVFERAATIGGKSASFEIDGHTFDLGTHICTSQYRNVKELAAEVGCATELLTPLRTLDVKRRALYAPGTSFISEMGSYSRLLEQKAQRFPGIARPGLHHESRALSRSLPEWIAAQDVGALLQATGLDVGYTSSGYGFLGDPRLAALYYLKFVELSGFLDPSPQEDYEGEWTIAGCFMNLWRAVADRLEDVRCGADVKAVERREDGVAIRTADGDFEYDDVMLALPLDRSLEILDASEEERHLFSRIRYNVYYTTVASAVGLPRDGFYMLQQHSVDDRNIGRCTAFHHRHPDSDVYTFYAYGGPGIGEREIARLLEEDIETLGGQLVRGHGQRRWDFFPHVDLADVKEGYFDRLEALQGQCRTYYAGSLLSFELVECVIDHARDLVARHFMQASSGAPARARATRAGGRRATRHSEESIRAWLVERLSAELQVPPSQIDPAAALETYAIDSIVANSLVGSFSDWLGFRVTPALIVEHPTIHAIAAYLSRG
jgi:acyl carrier protein